MPPAQTTAGQQCATFGSAEMLRDYVHFKDRRKSREAQVKTEKAQHVSLREPVRPSVPSVFSELPPALEIRRPRSNERKRTHSSSSADSAQLSETSRNLSSHSAPDPRRRTSKHSAEELARKVEELDKRLKPFLPTAPLDHPEIITLKPSRDVAGVPSDRNLQAVRTRRLRGRSNLSAVAEEDERLLSERKTPRQVSARVSRSEENLRLLADDVRSSMHNDEADGKRPLGSARMTESIQRLQSVNENLVEHLRKMMVAYSDLRDILETRQESYTLSLTEYEARLEKKDDQLQSLTMDLKQAKSEAESARKLRDDDATRNQVVEMKLAQALGRLTKLQRENDELKSSSSARSESQSATEKTLLKKVMELEMEAVKNRTKQDEIDRLTAENFEKDAIIKNASDRENELKTALTDRNNVSRVNGKLFEKETELSRLQEKMFTAETILEQRNSELREAHEDLENSRRRVEKLEKDLERFVKEKDRAYEKIDEVRGQSERDRMEERKIFESHLSESRKEAMDYKSRCEDIEKELARWRVVSGENSARYRMENSQLKTRIDDLALENQKFKTQFEQITAELQSIDVLGSLSAL